MGEKGEPFCNASTNERKKPMPSSIKGKEHGEKGG